MSILFDQIIHEFDPDPKFAEWERAQPVSVEPSDDFVILTQWDCTGEMQHCILVERQDVQALIEALQRS